MAEVEGHARAGSGMPDQEEDSQGKQGRGLGCCRCLFDAAVVGGAGRCVRRAREGLGG